MKKKKKWIKPVVIILIVAAVLFVGSRTLITVLLALGIAIVFIMVYVITWINERKYAADFNEKLKAYQAEQE